MTHPRTHDAPTDRHPPAHTFFLCVVSHADIAQDEGATKAEILDALRNVIAEVESWNLRSAQIRHATIDS